MRAKKFLLLSLFTFLFWVYFHQASASMSIVNEPLSPVPVIGAFIALNLPVDCKQVETNILSMQREYRAGIGHIKKYFMTLHSAAAKWHDLLKPAENKTVRFAAGQFAPLEVSAVNVAASAEHLGLWIEEFSNTFAIFSDGYVKCSANKNKQAQIEAALAKFFEMSSESLGVTAGLLDYTSREIQRWHADWSLFESKDVFIDVDRFEAVVTLSNNMAEAAGLVQENADLALAELDVITEGIPNGRGSDHRAVQLLH